MEKEMEDEMKRRLARANSENEERARKEKAERKRIEDEKAMAEKLLEAHIQELKSFKQNVTTALWGIYTLVLGVIAKIVFWK